MPWRNVAVDDGQPEQAPFMFRYTTPSLKPLNVMSPPSLATAGRTRVSISSLIVATVWAAAEEKNSSGSSVLALALLSSGAPDMKCSMIPPRIMGLRCCHSAGSSLVTAMKSEPKNTPLTPSTANSRSASGDWAASSRLRRSSVPVYSTGRPGRGFKVAGLGGALVWVYIAGFLQLALPHGPP